MFIRVVEFIGRLLSNVFGKFGKVTDKMQSGYSELKTHTDIASSNAKVIIRVSANQHKFVNYFQARVVSEFLKMVAAMLPYKYDKESDKYIVYLVRLRTKSWVEYIKFSKDREDDYDSTIYFTQLNNFLGTVVTYNIGNTSTDVLSTKSYCDAIYDSISGIKAPFYVAYDGKGGFGDVDVIFDCWRNMVRLIERKIINNDIKEDFLERVKMHAGIVMVMSYFKSLDNPFYKNSYLPSKYTSIVDVIKEFNSCSFNINKIKSFEYDIDLTRGRVVCDVIKHENITLIGMYGVNVTVTGVLTGDYLSEVYKFNYKLCDFILKHEDAALRHNFLFYIISTGGLTKSELHRFKEEENGKLNGIPLSKELVELNEVLRPELARTMSAEGYSSDSFGVLYKTEDDGKLTDSKVNEGLDIKTIEYKEYTPEELIPIKSKVDEELISVNVIDTNITTNKVSSPIDLLKEEASLKPKRKLDRWEQEREDKIRIIRDKPFRDLTRIDCALILDYYGEFEDMYEIKDIQKKLRNS